MDPIIFVEEAGKHTSYGKALQLYLRGKPCLLISPALSRHDDALVHFLTSERIGFRDQIAHDIPNHWRPQAKGDQYHLIGVGWARIHPQEIVLDVGSDSYLLPPCERHAKEITRLLKTKTISVKPSFRLARDSVY